MPHQWNGHFFFRAWTPETGCRNVYPPMETSAGTHVIADLVAWCQNHIRIAIYLCSSKQIYFIATDAFSPTRLWKTQRHGSGNCAR
jgi:hypothetical protein